MLVRRIARPLLASSFVYGGIDTLRNPQSRVPGAAPVVDQIAQKADQQLPVQLPRYVEQYLKVTAGAQVPGKTVREVLVELVASIDKFYEG